MERAIVVLAAAVAMHACILGWNAAAHRRSERAALALGSLFWLLVAIFAYSAIRVAV
jgi:hypothetical protein